MTQHVTRLLQLGEGVVFVSINRFERKKNVALAIRAFAALQPQVMKQCRLVIAGEPLVLQP